MKNKQQSQNLLLKVDQRSTFRKTLGNMNKNLQRNNVVRQVDCFCISYFAALSEKIL